MKTLTVIGLALVGWVWLSMPAMSGSLQDKVEQQAEEETLNKRVEMMNSYCKTNITLTVDWSTFPSEQIKSGSECEDLAWAARSGFCKEGKDMERAAFRKAVKKMICKFNPKAKPDEMKLDLKDGTLTWTFGPKPKQPTEFIIKELMSKL